MSTPQLATLLALVAAYRAASGASESVASRHILGHPARLAQVRDAGSDLTTASYNAALQRIYDRWPAGSARPEALTDALLAAGLGRVSVQTSRARVTVDGFGAEARIDYAAGSEAAQVAAIRSVEEALRLVREGIEAKARATRAA